MEKYITVIVVVAVVIAIQIITRLIGGKRKKTDKVIKGSKIIRQPKYYLYVGIGGIILFSAGALFSLLAPESMIADYEPGIRLPVALVFFAICIPYVLIIMLQANWKIEVGEKEFTFRNAFGKKRTYQYEDVNVKLLSRCVRFYRKNNPKDRHIVGISPLQENWDCLEKTIMAYKKAENAKKKETE